MTDTVHEPRNAPLDGRGWAGKGLAGLVLGATLATGLMGVFGLLFHADAQFRTAAAQILRWFPGPVWGVVLALSFLFRSPVRAWTTLGVLNGVVWAAYLLLRGILV
ncbi:hypothetical protein [Gluconobacter oxydans]|uniref:hypothetical protein n=1 Tax=Gluconobacter oxydans TaxID=442 RepID=UPI000A8F1E7B|nr:hypothetical protein [Gluconobacter oxydans]